ncbi:MAG: hypothetical protein R3Y44_03325 [Rikenellaceae bacterium]
MKKILTLSLLLSTLFFTSCVDKDFNLNDLADDNIGLGDAETEVSAPTGDIEIALDDILTPTLRASESYTLISQTVEDVLPLASDWLSDDFKEYLTSGDSEITLSAECSPFPEGLPDITVEIFFGDVALFDTTQTLSYNDTKITSTALSQDDIDVIVSATELRYKLYFAEESFTCDFENYENLTITLTLTRTGAITF